METRHVADVFWNSEAWYAYERAYGDAPGTRATLLADAAWSTRVLNLTQDEAALWRGVRRSYHGIINQLTKDPAFQVVDVFPEMLLVECRQLQDRVAPDETRSSESWQVQADWLRNNVGLCLAALRDSRLVAFAYAIQYGRWAYYGFGKTAEPNAHHALVWALIKRLRADGITWFELGWQGEARDEKGLAIEFFKRGWGGRDVRVQLSGRP